MAREWFLREVLDVLHVPVGHLQNGIELGSLSIDSPTKYAHFLAWTGGVDRPVDSVGQPHAQSDAYSPHVLSEGSTLLVPWGCV